MEATIDIDIGGTFTDCVVVCDGRMVRSKTPTTRYNLSVGFRRAIEECATELGLALDNLLSTTSVIRYSTTLAMNSLIERTGPRLGLITTAGFEDMTIIGRARQWADGLPIQERRHVYRQQRPVPLIPRDRIVGVKERVDSFGNVVIPIDKEDVRKKLQYLVDRGARGFVVSLLWSFLNSAHERIVRELIEEEYPDRYLGHMPVLLSSEVQPKWHEYPRTNVTILCAYLHGEMMEQLSALGEDLREHGYRKPLTIVNNMGGMAKVTRTMAVDTYGAGPVAGLFGASYICKGYGFPKVIVTDMGGTSFDYGLVLDGSPRFYQDWPVIDRWATEKSMVEVSTIGAGGGSIAWINEHVGGRLEVGPRSAGSNPGPACYDLGGNEPTVTDADVVLGYIDPDYFLAGKIPLNKDKAYQALEKLAKPLGLTPEEMAVSIRRVVDGNMGNVLQNEVLLKGYDPRDFVLFAYGGAGPTHCAGYGDRLGVRKIVTFPFASVFCALGSATMDLRHIYESSRHIALCFPGRPGKYLVDFSVFNSTVDGLTQQALRDMASEGFKPGDVLFGLELEMRYGKQPVLTRFQSPRTRLRSEPDVQAVCDAFHRAYVARNGELSTLPEAGMNVENLYLVAAVSLPKPKLPVYELEEESPKNAYKGERKACWEQSASFTQSAVFDLDLLRPGNIVAGPAIVEAKDTTLIVPPGKKLSFDHYRNGIMESL